MSDQTGPFEAMIAMMEGEKKNKEVYDAKIEMVEEKKLAEDCRSRDSLISRTGVRRVINFTEAHQRTTNEKPDNENLTIGRNYSVLRGDGSQHPDVMPVNKSCFCPSYNCICTRY